MSATECRHCMQFAWHECLSEIALIHASHPSYENSAFGHLIFCLHVARNVAVDVPAQSERQQTVFHHATRQTLSVSCRYWLADVCKAHHAGSRGIYGCAEGARFQHNPGTDRHGT